MAKKKKTRPSPRKLKLKLKPRVPKPTANPPNEATIHAAPGLKKNWQVEKLFGMRGAQVHWHCDKPNFIIFFPSSQNPLVESNEVVGTAGEATATVKTDLVQGKFYHYCALVWEGDETFLVEGHSPPEMEIG
jgi:hypothetical protein